MFFVEKIIVITVAFRVIENGVSGRINGIVVFVINDVAVFIKEKFIQNKRVHIYRFPIPIEKFIAVCHHSAERMMLTIFIKRY